VNPSISVCDPCGATRLLRERRNPSFWTKHEKKKKKMK